MRQSRISSLTNPSAPDQPPPAASEPRTPRGVLRGAWNWLSEHEAEPAPYDAGVPGRIALGLVACLVILYIVVMSGYVVGLQNAFLTSAEDLGIMDQVLWNTSHGHFMIQSICNSVTDTNCLGPVFSRFAIHFEPILIVLSLFYLVIPNVNFLLVLQVVVVGTGAFPAYLLATRRLRNVVWGLVFAGIFLIYPSLQAAVIFSFHPETLAATTVMWALYFLAVRRYRWLILFCFITLLCKETLTLDVIAIGAFVALIQRRPRIGLILIAMGAGMLALALLTMHIASPTGGSPVAGRLGNLEHSPLATLAAMVKDPRRHAYLLKLLAPSGFLALLSPWMLALAVPSIFLNMASSDSLMYSGLYQYNTDIVPILVAASIDALVWLAPLLERYAAYLRQTLAERLPQVAKRVIWLVRPQLLALVIIAGVGIGGRTSVQQTFHVDAMIVRETFPSISQHDQLGQRIAESVPQGASVSAQSTLVPHLSERYRIYQFPFQDDQADYVFVDVTTGDYYPFPGASEYVSEVQRLLASCQFHVATAQDGYLLLHHTGAASTPPGKTCTTVLPASFYTFAYTNSPPAGVSRAAVEYAGSLELIGYTLSPSSVNLAEGVTTVTTYWKVLAKVSEPLTIVTTFTRPNGTRIVMEDAWTQSFLPPSQWRPGSVVTVVSWPEYLLPKDKGNLLFGVEVRAGAPQDIPKSQTAVPATLLSAAGTGPDGLPRLTTSGNSALLAILPVY
ncbi:MAG: DUF2079 domain-containing protein [Ktedonobacterales bacterium]